MSDSTAPARPPRWPLVAVLVAALGLRLVGLDWGVPNDLHRFSYHPDEWQAVETGLGILVSGDWNPHFFNYPSLQIYLVSLALRLGVLLFGAAESALGGLYVVARLVTVVMGVATVALTARLGARVGGGVVGLVAAALLAVLPLHVVNSHYATVDVPLVFWWTLAVTCALESLSAPEERARPWALAAGVAVGLAASTKYNGALALPVTLGALAYRCGTAGWRLSLAQVAIAALTFGLTSPFVLLDPAARPAVRYELFVHPRETAVYAGLGPGWWFHLTRNAPVGAGTLFVVAALLGVVLLARRRAPADVLVLVWLALPTASLLATRELYLRYLLPLLPPLALAAAAALASVRGGRAVVALAVVVALGPTARSAARVIAMAAGDARDEAAAWCLAHISPGERVGLFGADGTLWFRAAPLSRNNGGARTRLYPDLPRHRLVLDPRAWFEDPPNWLVVDDADVHDHSRDPAWLERWRELLGAFEPVQRYGGGDQRWRRWLDPRDLDLHDWLYTQPGITIYRRRS